MTNQSELDETETELHKNGLDWTQLVIMKMRVKIDVLEEKIERLEGQMHEARSDKHTYGEIE